MSEMLKKTKCLRPDELRFSFLQFPLPGRQLVLVAKLSWLILSEAP